MIVGSDEYENGAVAIKDLATGEQSTVKINELGDWTKSVAQSS